MSNKARRRQKLTGEKYQTALIHLRVQCRQCQNGKPCAACSVDPCWTCRPECTVREAKEGTAGPPKCLYGDADAVGIRHCTLCRKPWQPMRRAMASLRKELGAEPSSHPEMVRYNAIKVGDETQGCIHRSVTDYACNGCGATVGWPSS